MTHVVVSYPSLDANWTMLEAMDAAGVDLVELQLPFSEPIADGPLFVRANQEAIRAGTAWATYFDFATRASKRSRFPLLFMGYYNSVFRMGGARFCTRLADAGMRGFIIAASTRTTTSQPRCSARWPCSELSRSCRPGPRGSSPATTVRLRPFGEEAQSDACRRVVPSTARLQSTSQARLSEWIFLN